MDLPKLEHPDRLVKASTLATTWITSADTKATALLGLSGALLTLFAVELAAFNDKKILHGLVAFFALVYCALSIFSIAAAGGALWPRIDRKAMLAKKGIAALDHSPSFFGDLGGLSARDFIITLNQADPQTDALEQALVITSIAREKMYWIGISVKMLVGALISLGLCVLAVALQ